MKGKIKKFKVEEFSYGGLFVGPKYNPDGTIKIAPYTAEFKEWTTDPGMVICICSDGKERRIPTCQLQGFKVKDYPLQEDTPGYTTATKEGVMFLAGPPSHS